MDSFIRLLESLSDEKNKAFEEKLVKGSKYPILGIKLPVLRGLAKDLVRSGGYRAVLDAAPVYFEQVMVKGFVLADLSKTFEDGRKNLYSFLPLVDNWSVCDSVASSFKIFAKHRESAKNLCLELFCDERTYYARFGLVLALFTFRSEEFDLDLLSRAGSIPFGDYYLNMGVAWFFSVALVKNFGLAFDFLRSADINVWTKKKALTKALESFRVSDENKDKIRALRDSI